jgi:hypothetical protein
MPGVGRKAYGAGWVFEAEGNYEVEIVKFDGEKDGKLKGSLIFVAYTFFTCFFLPNLSDSRNLGGGCSPGSMARSFQTFGHLF